MSIERIFGLEHLQEATAAAGSNLEFRQLHKGYLQGHAWIVKSSECALQFLGASLPVEAEGDYPEGMHALLSPFDGMVLTQNGVVAQEGEWILLRAGADAWATNSLRIGGLLIVYFPTTLFDKHCLAIVSRTLSPPATAIKLHPGRIRLAEFNRLARIWRLAADFGDADAAATRIMTLTIDVWADGAGIIPASLNSVSRLTALDRAREFINASLNCPVDLSELSRHAGVSHRTLRRVFARELGLSPSQYLRIRRLNAVRHDLLDPNQGNRTISEIATSYGVGHLGRFSSEFQRHFGFLPSRLRETARRQSRAIYGQ